MARPTPEPSTSAPVRSGPTPVLTAERTGGLRTTDPKYTPLLSRLLAPGFASTVTGPESVGVNRSAVVSSSGNTAVVVSQSDYYTDWGATISLSSGEPPLSTADKAGHKTRVKPKGSRRGRPDSGVS